MTNESTYVSYASIDYDLSFPEVPSPCASSECGWSYKDEILLDPDDRPLELAVNSRSPMTFHLVAGLDRNAEILKNLRSESFTPEQRRKLIEKFNLKADVDDDELRSSLTSSPPSTPRRTSINDSIPGKVVEGRIRSTSAKMAATPKKANGLDDVIIKESLKEKRNTAQEKTLSTTKATRSNTMPANERPATFQTPPERHNGVARSGRVRNLKQKNTASIERRGSRSASARKLFLSLRKYRARSSSKERRGSKGTIHSPSDNEDTLSPAKSSELSSDVNLPGILKVFGNAVSPGTNYKSVMATTSSNAKELVKMALERYGIPKHQAKYHVLCEVVGRLSEDDVKETTNKKALKIKTKNNREAGSTASSVDSKVTGVDFIEDYVRPLNDHEKPLILQSYWKPLDGHCRRFEIRRRSKVFKKGEKDHATRDVNTQARRLLIQKSRSRNNLHHIPSLTNEPRTDSESEEEKITSFDILQSSGNLRQSFDDLRKSPGIVGRRGFQDEPEPDAYKEDHDEAMPSLGLHGEPSNVTQDRVTPDGDSSCCSPIKCEQTQKLSGVDLPPFPYLITLQGNEDNLIHSLDNDEILIGSDVTDFKLIAADVLRHHCVIKRRLEILFSENDNYEVIKKWSVSIAPLHQVAEIRVNGVKTTSKHSLQHGEVIAIGKHHIFMYKDPSSHVNLSNVAAFSFANLSSKESDNCSTQAHGPHTSLHSNQSSTPCPPAPLKVIKTELSYLHENEDVVLEEIFNSVGDLSQISPDNAMTPATLLCHCIIHSCLNFELQHKQGTLLKIASNLRSLTLNSTRNVSVQEIHSSSDHNTDLQQLLPSLQSVVYWMSNSLEVFQFLQKDLIPIIQKKTEEEKQKGHVDPDMLESANSFVVNEEILALLEEVVMYAFQQLVYYLTKTLYGSLPSVLECNPFADGQDTTLCVRHVTEVYACAREMTQQYDVNSRISEQLFAYLFFFTNVSLFNTLMEEDASTKYYRWEMGVRIRGNLEFIESWAVENDYMDQCSNYLEKISSLANLLATPKGQFIKSKWESFRENFPALSCAQLHKVLNGYRLPGNQLKPKTWLPNPDDMNDALNKNLIVESYDNHPPLMLPVSSSKLSLSALPNDPGLQDLLQRVKDVALTSSDRGIINQELRNVIREQPDGGELSNYDVVASSQDVSDAAASLLMKKSRDINSDGKSVDVDQKNSMSHHLPDPLPHMNGIKSETASSNGCGRIVSSSSCSISSEPEAVVIKQHKSPHQQRKLSEIILKPSDAINDLVKSENSDDDCDEVIVLPISETASYLSKLSSNNSQSISRSPSSEDSNISKSSRGAAQGMPKEVFIVDIKKGSNGLGVGLVDGLITPLAVSGVFVRSLVPDGPGNKHSHTKHHDVLKCWLQEGRLQLGDRILAANGVSLINMSYYDAMKIVKQAGENVRLLVGRCGSDVAVKMTSSSC